MNQTSAYTQPKNNVNTRLAPSSGVSFATAAASTSAHPMKTTIPRTAHQDIRFGRAVLTESTSTGRHRNTIKHS